jgi:RNA polymerase sigma-70 factor (ECF subfamily)
MGEMSSSNINLHDADSFAHLFNKTHLHIFRYIYGLSGGPRHEVEDLTAETYTRAWKARHRFKGDEDAAFRWLIQIARNLVIDISRRTKVRGKQESFEEISYQGILQSGDLTPEEQITKQSEYKILVTLLNNLAYQQREMLVLRYILGWQVKRIATHLNMPENTVSVYIRRTLEKLRKDWPEN